MEEKKNLSLVHMSQSYKINIPEEVEKKIRFTCSQVWNTEWSGTLFYTYSGSFENDDLEIHCKDIFIMDIGNATYTEFDMSPDVIAYITENPELLDCQMGLIHSHNNMATFFSGTDQATLLEEGKDRNNFVSLIVNNEGTYTAAITRRLQEQRKVSGIVSYEFFGEGKVNSDNNHDYEYKHQEIQWFDLKINKWESNDKSNSIYARLEEIKKNKEAAKTKPIKYPTLYTPHNIPFYYNGSDYDDDYYNSSHTEECYLDKSKSEKKKTTLVDKFDNFTFDDNLVNKSFVQLITGSITINKIDIDTWILNMEKAFDRRFGNTPEGMKNFEAWADGMIDFLIQYTEDPELHIVVDDTDVEMALHAEGIIKKLKEVPSNKYIEYFINLLEYYKG